MVSYQHTRCVGNAAWYVPSSDRAEGGVHDNGTLSRGKEQTEWTVPIKDEPKIYRTLRKTAYPSFPYTQRLDAPLCLDCSL